MNSKNQKGFTLVELMVVMAVFLFVIGAAIGIFISIIEYQRRLLTEQELLNQISYVEEYMSKALRVAKTELNEVYIDPSGNYHSCMTDANNNDHPGYSYLLTRIDSSTGLYEGIKFIDESDLDPSGNPACEEFFLGHDGGVSTNPLVLQEIKNGGSPVDLTPPDLTITSLKFSINGTDGTQNGFTLNGQGCADAYSCGACTDATQCGTLGATAQPRITILLGVEIPGDAAEPIRTIETTVSQRNLNAK